jgi:fructokinase
MLPVFCIGEALIDMICTDKGSPLMHGNHFLKKAGGAPANVAAAIAALGGQVQLAACVGADPFGQHLIEVMQSFGVDTRYMLVDEQHFTTLAFVSLLESGERDFYFNRGADACLSMHDLQEVQPSDYAMVHFGSATAFLPGSLQHTYQALMQEAVAQHTFFTFDPNYRQLLFGQQQDYFREKCMPFVQQAGFFKVSDEEALLLSGRATLPEAVAWLQGQATGTFAITLGAQGTLLACGGATQVVPSIPVQVMDTTGAGDAFTGAMLYQLSLLPTTALPHLLPEEWAAMVANANKAGARTCQYMGAMEAYKHLNETIFD